MPKPTLMAAAGLAAALASTLAALPAEARPHGRMVSAQGPAGRGYVHSRWVDRGPGRASVHRSLQTNGGYGVRSDRFANWGDGRYEGGASHVLNNGRSFGRSTSLQDNGDGTIGYQVARDRLDGSSVSRSGVFDDPRD